MRQEIEVGEEEDMMNPEGTSAPGDMREMPIEADY